MRKFKRLTQKEYDNIKTLLGAGLSQKQVSDVTKRSSSTVYYISKSTDMKDYFKIVQDSKQGQEKKPVTPPSDIVDMLRRIDNKLNMQVALLEKLVEKKRWF